MATIANRRMIQVATIQAMLNSNQDKGVSRLELEDTLKVSKPVVDTLINEMGLVVVGREKRKEFFGEKGKTYATWTKVAAEKAKAEAEAQKKTEVEKQIENKTQQMSQLVSRNAVPINVQDARNKLAEAALINAKNIQTLIHQLAI